MIHIGHFTLFQFLELVIVFLLDRPEQPEGIGGGRQAPQPSFFCRF
jgi:hypothetical protein